MLNEWVEFTKGLKKMVDKKVVLVRFGNSSQGVSFSSDGENDRKARRRSGKCTVKKFQRTLLSFKLWGLLMCPLFL